MSKFCFVTGKKVSFGNNVSNSNRKIRRKFLPNLHRHKFWSDEKGCFVKVNLSKKGLKFINKIGIDNFIKNNKVLF
ncbi:MAG TPA: 50S ribosomal protein L28 [Candidatus Azoamicus sp.]